MGARSGGLIFFDITLLVLRAPFKTPTGIARVELAYAKELLNRYPERIRFIVALQNIVQVIPRSVVAGYLEATERSWEEQQSGLEPIIRVARFLGIGPSLLLRNRGGDGSQSAAVLAAADILLRAVVRGLVPRNLSRLGHHEQRNAYVNVSGSNISSPRIERWLARRESVSGIFMLHDVIPLTHPEYVRRRVTARHARYIHRVARFASVIVANSSYTAETVTSFIADHGQDTPPRIVVPLGVSAAFTRGARTISGMPPYFVFVSTIEPRKNHMMLLQVWSRLAKRFGDRTPKLILAGRRGWENENVVDILERAHTSSRHVLECHGLCDEALALLIKNARATLMPSHVEGFGLPVAESLALGTPMICSDIPPFREIAGDVPEYADPLAGQGWARLITEYSKQDSPARAAQLRRMESRRPPSWSGHFDEVCQAIDLLVTGLPLSGARAGSLGRLSEMEVAVAAS